MNGDPRSYEAERALIGVLLMGSHLHDTAAQVVAGHDFSHPQWREAFERIGELSALGKHIDPVSVSTGDPTELISALSETRSLSGVAQRAEVIAEYARLRRVDDALRTAQHRIRESDHLGVEAVITEALAEIGRAAVRREEAPKTVTHAQAAEAYARDWRRRCEADRAVPGWKTGLDELDNAIGGIEQGLVTVIAARPGMGKTALALQVCEAVAEDSGGLVLFYSMEMPSTLLGGRLLARAANIPYDRLKDALIVEGDPQRVAAAVQRMHACKGRWLIDDRPGVRTDRIARHIRQHRRAHAAGNGPPVVAVCCDYLQRMTGDGRGGYEKLSRISRELADIAVGENVAVIEVAQLNREVEKRSSKVPMLSDLSGSGQIEQDASTIVFIYRDDYYACLEGRASADPGMALLSVAKQRNGEVCSVRVPWHGKFQRFGDLPR